MPMILLLAVAFLCGCVPSVIVHEYPNLGLITYQASEAQVHRLCFHSNWESCSFRPVDADVNGRAPCEIYYYNPETLEHELCLCNGGTEKSCN